MSNQGSCCGGSSSNEEIKSSGGGCCGSSSKAPLMPKDTGCCSNQVESSSEESIITITPSAIDAIKNAIAEEGEEGDNLRVSVVGGGCSGFQYNLDFEKESRMGDTVLDFDGVSIIIDPISSGYLKGTTIDYISGLNGTGFKFSNPNAKRTCGCGSSFS